MTAALSAAGKRPSGTRQERSPSTPDRGFVFFCDTSRNVTRSVSTNVLLFAGSRFSSALRAFGSLTSAHFLLPFSLEGAGSCFGRHTRGPAAVSAPSWNVL